MYINTTVPGNMTIANYAKFFPKTIAAASNRCVWDESSPNELTIDGKYKLTFTIKGTTYVYIRVKVSYADQVLVEQMEFSASSGGRDSEDRFPCSAGFALAENEKCINLKFRDYNTAMTNFNHDTIFAVTESGADVFGYSTGGAYAMNNGLKKSDGTQSYTVPSIIGYAVGGDGLEVDMTDRKILLSGTQKAGAISGMFDCSTVTANMVYPCTDGKEYYALNANTLIKV